jgi:hypothetical protein
MADQAEAAAHAATQREGNRSALISIDSIMPQNIRIRLNVGGTVFHTSLYTLMEGARRGGVVFQCLCTQILGPHININATAKDREVKSIAWHHCVVPAQAEQYRVEHFIDADPIPFSFCPG